MKLNLESHLHLIFIPLFLLCALTGCQRERYEMGNIKNSKSESAPAYTATPNAQPSVNR